MYHKMLVVYDKFGQFTILDVTSCDSQNSHLVLKSNKSSASNAKTTTKKTETISIRPLLFAHARRMFVTCYMFIETFWACRFPQIQMFFT